MNCSFLKQIMLTIIIIFAILLKDTEGFSATRTNNGESEFDLTRFMTFLGLVILGLFVLFLCGVCMIYLIEMGCCACCMDDEENNNDKNEERNLPNNGENVTYIFVQNVPLLQDQEEPDGFSAIFRNNFCDNSETLNTT